MTGFSFGLRSRFQIPFRISLALATACLIALTSSFIILVVFQESYKTAEKVAKTHFEITSAGIAGQLSELLEVKSEWAEFGAFQNETVAPLSLDGNQHPAIDLLLGLVRLDSTVYSAFFGNQDGRFMQIINLHDDSALAAALGAPNGSDHIRRIVAEDARGVRTDRWHFISAPGGTLGTRETKGDVYDPRVRPWYGTALATDKSHLSEPYVFNSNGKLGVTVSRRLPGGMGVLGLDLTFDGISEFLSRQELSPNGQAYLFDDEFQMWGANGGTFSALSDVRDSDSADVRRLANLAVSLDGRALTQREGTRADTILDFVQPWAAPSGRTVYIGMTAPLIDFTIDMESMLRRILIVSALALAGALPLSYLLAGQLSKALQRLTGEAERMRDFDFSEESPRPSFIRELHSLGHSFGLMKTALQSRTQDLSSAQRQMEKLVELGISLSAERDFDRLMESILRGAKELCNADGGSLYLRTEEDTLRFTCMLTDSLGIVLGGTSGKDIKLPPVNLYDPETGEANHGNIASHATLSGEPVNIPDAYQAEGFDFSGTKKFDESTGYRSQSFLTVPMKNRQGRVIGVLQLLNALDPGTGSVISFAQASEGFVMALATQAGVALENAQLLEEQRLLLDSFIELIAAAIDAKSAYTGGHCERVPQIAKWIAEAACESSDEPFNEFALSEDDWYEFHIAAWLHDCGKVTTPEYVVDKATKLETIYNRIHEVRTRFEVLIRDADVAFWKGLAEGGDEATLMAERDDQIDQLENDFAFVAGCNVGGEFMNQDDKDRIAAIGAQTWLRRLDDRLGLSMEEEKLLAKEAPTGLPAVEPLLADKMRHIIERENRDRPWGDNPHGFQMHVPEHMYNRGEIHNLCIARGTLTAEERFKINDHIIQTIIMLEQLPFPKHLARVPEIAGGHHETLIGTGYPRELSKESMSLSSRIMAIADIFEALTASDRPYKQAKTLSESLRIMSAMRDDQHIDADLFDLFLKSGIHRKYADVFLTPDQADDVEVVDYLRS